MEVGKFYQNKISGRIVKVLAVATNGSTFVETTKPSESLPNYSGSNNVGNTEVLRTFLDWEEYVPIQTFWVNIYKDLYKNNLCGYYMGTVLYDTKALAEKDARPVSTWLKAIPIEV